MGLGPFKKMGRKNNYPSGNLSIKAKHSGNNWRDFSFSNLDQDVNGENIKLDFFPSI